MNSPNTALIKRVEKKYGALDGLEQGGITYLKIALDKIFNMSDVAITLIQEFFKKLAQDGVAKYQSDGNVTHIKNLIKSNL